LPVVLRLKRFGRLNLPTFRLVATDSRMPRDGRILEALGYYLPLMPRGDEQLKLHAERVKYWLGVGAQPSATAITLLERAGIPLPVRKRRERTKSKKKPKPWMPPKKKAKQSKAKAAAGAAAEPAADQGATKA
jgi:small subunit ribosomal protein S16